MYMLEITMESRASWAQKYIRRSFPIITGRLDISKYGYPYSRYNAVEIGEVFERNDTGLKMRFDGEEISVYLNGFTTVKREYAINDPHTKVPHTEIVHITFYLYIK